MKRTRFGFWALGFLLLATPALAEETAPVVHVDAADTVVVERADDGSRVCQAPCDRPLEPSVYRASGEGIRSSNEFRVPARSEPIKVRVDAKPNGGFVAGIVLTSLSGVFLAGGLAMLGGASMMSNSFSSWGASLLFDGGAFALLGGSIGFGISGLYLLTANLHSRARVLEGDLHVTASRDPAPRALSLPIVKGSF
ncbi:MAG TPA: hypothetical protein VGH87_25885 [Polyangiaceae bacterium]